MIVKYSEESMKEIYISLIVSYLKSIMFAKIPSEESLMSPSVFFTCEVTDICDSLSFCSHEILSSVRAHVAINSPGPLESLKTFEICQDFSAIDTLREFRSVCYKGLFFDLLWRSMFPELLVIAQNFQLIFDMC